MKDCLLKLASYLQKESHDTEFLYLEDLIKTAAERDAKYLSGINLGALRKEFPKKEGEEPREYYRMLNQLAANGPYFSSKAIEFVRNNIDEDLIPANRKEFIKWLATELNKASDRQYPDVNDIAMIKDWLLGSGWPEGEAIVLADLDLEYALMASKEWHDAPAGPVVAASEAEKKVIYSFSNGSKIVYEPIASVDPVARKKLGQKLGLCLRQGLYSNDEQGEIYSIRSPNGKAGACIRIERNAVKEIKGPGNHASSVSIPNSKMIKEWLKEGGYSFSHLGQTDYNRMPPTSWKEAKEVWNKSRADFIRKGWCRGYREEFKPELINTLKFIFSEYRGKEHNNDRYLLSVLLKERVHHVYSNEFAKHLDDIARDYPELYLLNNLPKTYSSTAFSEAHEEAVDNLTEMRPNKIIDYLNPKHNWRGKVFDDNIMDMIKKREETAVHKIVGMSEKILLDDRSLGWNSNESGGNDWMIMSLFKNSYILKKYPDLAESIAENFGGLDAHSGSPYSFPEIVKGAVDSRLYRRGGIFKRIVDEAVSNIEKELEEPDSLKREDDDQPEDDLEAGSRGGGSDELPASADEFNVDPSSGAEPEQGVRTDPGSFFRLGLHMTKEYKHLTDSVAKNIVDNFDGTKHMQVVPEWNRIVRLKGVSDETKKRIANLYLNDTLSSRYGSRYGSNYLRNRLFYKNPLFLETTIRAIKSTDLFRTYAGRRDVERNSQVSRKKENPERYGHGTMTLPDVRGNINSWSIFSFFPRLIKETEGLVPDELTHDMREAIVDVAKKEDLKDDYATSAFLRKATSRKNFPELYKFIIKNTLQDRWRSLFSSLQKLNEERHPTRHLQMHVLGNMIWDLKHSVRMLHLIRKHDLHSELEDLPKFIRLFGKVNYTLAVKLKEYIKNTIENNLNPDNYNDQVLKHIGVLRMYINFGWHKPNSSYSEKLSRAIEEVSKSLFPAIKEIYEKELEEKKMSLWNIFGPRADVDKLLAKYYYNDPDYPESLVFKDEEFIEFLKEELTKLGGENPKAKEEVFAEFIYGFMYWSISTFNEMGEEAAIQEADVENYIEQMKNIWPKRTGLGYDEFFKKGFSLRDQWERTSYDGPWKPVPYDEEEVEQQLSKDYMSEYYEDLNEPELDMEEPDVQRVLEQEPQEEKLGVSEESREDTVWRSEPLDDSEEEKRARARKLWMLSKFAI